MNEAPTQESEIKRRRLARGETQQQVAVALGVAITAYCKWDRGEGLPDAGNLVKLADHFGCEPRALLPADLVGRAEGAA